MIQHITTLSCTALTVHYPSLTHDFGTQMPRVAAAVPLVIRDGLAGFVEVAVIGPVTLVADG